MFSHPLLRPAALQHVDPMSSTRATVAGDWQGFSFDRWTAQGPGRACKLMNDTARACELKITNAGSESVAAGSESVAVQMGGHKDRLQKRRACRA